MNTIERWVLRTTDSDACWIGLGWLRPDKSQRIGVLRMLFTSFVLGLPGVVLGVGLVYVALGKVDPGLCLFFLGLAMLVEVPLHVIWAHYWNRRAKTLDRGEMARCSTDS